MKKRRHPALCESRETLWNLRTTVLQLVVIDSNKPWLKRNMISSLCHFFLIFCRTTSTFLTITKLLQLEVHCLKLHKFQDKKPPSRTWSVGAGNFPLFSYLCVSMFQLFPQKLLPWSSPLATSAFCDDRNLFFPFFLLSSGGVLLKTHNWLFRSRCLYSRKHFLRLLSFKHFALYSRLRGLFRKN